ncbi:MAG: hypothetical protein COA67_12465 [Lutibacter sp.]|nr:MAG: hypothetical protein COA67_12465 [Lutibacter sp.]
MEGVIVCWWKTPTKAKRKRMNITDKMVRLSIGVEDAKDIILMPMLVFFTNSFLKVGGCHCLLVENTKKGEKNFLIRDDKAHF